MTIDMTDVITLILLVYPGAFVDIFYKKIAPESYEDNNDSDVMRMAKYFSYSIIIALVSLAFLSLFWKGGDTSGLEAALSQITYGWNSILYIMCSLVLAFVTALIIKPLNKFRTKKLSAYPKSLIELSTRDAWQDIMHDSNYDWNNVVCLVFQNSEVVSGGIVGHMPDDIIKKPSISFDYPDLVVQTYKNELNSESDEKYIEYPMVEYFMLDSGLSLRFYKANKLFSYINQCNITATSSFELEVEQEALEEVQQV